MYRVCVAAHVPSSADALASVLLQAGGDAARWMEAVDAAAGSETELSRAYAAAGRKLGPTVITATAEQEGILANGGLPGVAGWTRARAGRAWLLITAVPRLADADFVL